MKLSCEKREIGCRIKNLISLKSRFVTRVSFTIEKSEQSQRGIQEGGKGEEVD